jgi:hypothetical protein
MTYALQKALAIPIPPPNSRSKKHSRIRFSLSRVRVVLPGENSNIALRDEVVLKQLLSDSVPNTLDMHISTFELHARPTASHSIATD